MDHSPKKQLSPFKPRSFPPRKLNKNVFSALLKKANLSLEKYHSILLQSPSPQRLFFQKINKEAIASVKSQKVKTTFSDFLQWSNSKKSTKKSKLFLIENYKEALIQSLKVIQHQPISKKLLCELHKSIKRGTVLKTDLGCFRNRQNWIGPYGGDINSAYFYPPSPSDVESLMKDLFKYLNANHIEPLVQLTLFLAQLMIIHPFMDGNGRVARILIPLFLYQKKILPVPFLFMSNYFLKHRLKYFQTLFMTTEENKWEPWIAFFLKGVIIEVRKHISLLKKTTLLYHQIKQKIPLLDSDFLFFLFENPIFSNSSLKKVKGSASTLKKLQELKFIRKESDKRYHFSRLIKIFESI